MKMLLATFAVALTGLVFLPATASADHSRKAYGKCNSCGSTLYAYRTHVGYDPYRRPVYQYIKKPCYHPSSSSRYYHRSSPNVGFSFSIQSGRSHSYNPYYNSRYSRSYDSRYSRSYGYGNSCRSSRGSSFSIRIR